ncbi:glycosyltransferase family 4 protein [bacterium]|nr:glycosyltransferase family 4 protein [bacterium]
MKAVDSGKTVLVIAYYFPPSGGAGVQRVLKYVRYLTGEGWRPIVLTVTETAGFPARDETLLAEVPKTVRVVRTPIFEPYALYRRFTGRSAGAATDIASLAHAGPASIPERLSEWIRAAFFIPDARCFWRLPAVRAGLNLIAGEKVDVILSSAPPYTCHLIGRSLHRRTGIPWIAEFRDSWVGWLSTPARSGIAAAIDRRMERSVLRESDMVITATAGVRDDLRSRSPGLAGKRFRVISNGYDGADFQGVTGAPPRDRFTLTYTGSLYGKRSPEVLLNATARLLERDPSLQSQLRLRFVGRADPAFLRSFERFPGIVEYIPYVPHAESIAFLLNSSALLLIIDDAPVNRGILTGKLYEYLGARRPVLALAPEGEAADLIRELGAGTVAGPGDSAEVEKQLAAMITAWRQGTLTWNADETRIAALDRRVLTGRLAALLDEVTVKPDGGEPR